MFGQRRRMITPAMSARPLEREQVEVVEDGVLRSKLVPVNEEKRIAAQIPPDVTADAIIQSGILRVDNPPQVLSVTDPNDADRLNDMVFNDLGNEAIDIARVEMRMNQQQQQQQIEQPKE